MKSKKIIYILISLLLIFSLSLCVSCSVAKDDSRSQNQSALKDDKPSIVCTSFAAYDWVNNILGDESENWQVIRLNNNGADMHSYQPSAKDIAAITQCDILIYTGGLSEEWLSKLTDDESDFKGQVYSLIEATDEEGHDHSHDGEVCQLDEHVWLSPKNAAQFCQELVQIISQADPSHEETYKSNGRQYAEKLYTLDQSYQDVINSCENNTLIFADRFPFHYLVEDYGLSYYAAFPGCSAETEASFDTIISLAEKLNQLDIHALIITEHSSDSIARSIKNTAGRDDVKIYEMNSLQSVSDDDVKDGITYLGVMEANLNVIQQALE